jgi:hypothetical protein
MIDLRVAAPSTFLRPHAQTGLLVRQNGKIGAVTRDYKDMVAGIVRVSLDDALSWLGDGKLLSTHVLFPPPVYDFGYRDLLNFAPTPPSPHLLGRSSHPLLSVRCFRCFLISHFKIPTAISPVTTSGDRRKTGDRLCCPCWK